MGRVPPPQQHHHGLPPWHAVLVLGILASLSVAFLPTAVDLDGSVANAATFTRILFPAYLSLTGLVYVRAASAVIIFGLSTYALLLATFSDPLARHVITPYLEHSQLQRGKPLPLHGLYSQVPFTMWCWNLLGLSFAVNAYVTHTIAQGQPVAPWLLRVAVGLFETAAPQTLLVSAVVKYAIWPQFLKAGHGPNPAEVLKTMRALCFHNLNVVLALSEVTLWGGLPVRGRDVSLAVLFGCTYVMFTWAIRNLWNPAAGPQFLYFFFDTTLGYTTTLALVALCIVLAMFYGLFCVLQEILEHMGGGILLHGVTVAFVCAFVCRVRD